MLLDHRSNGIVFPCYELSGTYIVWMTAKIIAPDHPVGARWCVLH